MHINLHVNCCKTAAGRHQQTRARSFTLEKENVAVFYVLLCSATTWYCCIFLATQTHAHIDEHTPRNTHTTARARTTLARHSPASSEKKGETAKTGLHSSLNWLSSYSLSLPLEGHDVVVAWALKSYWSLGSPPSSTLCAQRTARVCVCARERTWMDVVCYLRVCVVFW